MNSLTVNREFHCEELPYIQSSGVQSRKLSAETYLKDSWLQQQDSNTKEVLERKR